MPKRQKPASLVTTPDLGTTPDLVTVSVPTINSNDKGKKVDIIQTVNNLVTKVEEMGTKLEIMEKAMEKTMERLCGPKSDLRESVAKIEYDVADKLLFPVYH